MGALVVRRTALLDASYRREADWRCVVRLRCVTSSSSGYWALWKEAAGADVGFVVDDNLLCTRVIPSHVFMFACCHVASPCSAVSCTGRASCVRVYTRSNFPDIIIESKY